MVLDRGKTFQELSSSLDDSDGKHHSDKKNLRKRRRRLNSSEDDDPTELGIRGGVSEEGEDESDESDESEEEEEVKCQVCSSTEMVLALLPCRHECLCKTCYDDQAKESLLQKERDRIEEEDLLEKTSTVLTPRTLKQKQKKLREEKADVYCPVCMIETTGYLTPGDLEEERKQEEENEKNSLNYQMAKSKARRLLASADIRRMFVRSNESMEEIEYEPLNALTVTEVDLADCFGFSVWALFKQVRVLSLLILFLGLFSLPLCLSYLTSFRDPATRNGISGSFWRVLSVVLREWTIITCEVDDCRDNFDFFLVIDAGGILFAGLALMWMRKYITRKHRKDRLVGDGSIESVSRRTLLVVQAPHLHEPITSENLGKIFMEEQEKKVQKQKALEESYGRRARFIQQTLPEVIPIKPVKITNYSCGEITFVRMALERLSVLEKIRSLEIRWRKLPKQASERIGVEAALSEKEDVLDDIEYDYFDDLFLQEVLGAFHREEFPVNFAFVVFETQKEAELARELLNKEENALIHYFKLTFGAPSNRYRCIGDQEAFYRSNIDWMGLEHIYWYGQSGGPGAFVVSIVLFVLVSNGVGFQIWDYLCRNNGTLNAAFMLVLWQEFTTFGVLRIFKWYAYPLRTFTLSYAVPICVVCVHMSSLLLWQVAWPDKPSYSLFGWNWWTLRTLDTIQYTQLIYIMQTLLWSSFGGKTLFLALYRLSFGKSHSQYDLERKYTPPEWSIALAYIAPMRTVVSCLVYSNVIPILSLLGFAHLTLVYGSEKSFLINSCRLSYRILTSFTVSVVSHLLQILLLLRSVLMIATIVTLLENAKLAHSVTIVVPQVMEVTVSVALLSHIIVTSIVFLVYIHQFQVISDFSLSCLTCGGRLCNFCRNKYKRRQDRLRKLYESKVKAEEGQLDLLLNQFDIKAQKYKGLLSDVVSLETLEKWKPQPEEYRPPRIRSVIYDDEDDDDEEEEEEEEEKESGAESEHKSKKSKKKKKRFLPRKMTFWNRKQDEKREEEQQRLSTVSTEEEGSTAEVPHVQSVHLGG